MFTARLADFNICIENKYQYVEDMCRDYITDGTPDITVSVSDREIDREQGEWTSDRGYLESLAVYRRISEWCPCRGAFLMHCVAIDVDGVGVLFLQKAEWVKPPTQPIGKGCRAAV